jgi:hypothetical protein
VEDVMNKVQIAVERDGGTASQSVEERRRILKELFAEWGMDPDCGDKVKIEVRPGETRGEAALRQLQEGFAASDVSEEEMQEEALRIREELYREYYGGK